MENGKVITDKNASQCTPYELRQELMRRGAMDIPENNINFRSLLQRLMQEFAKEEQQRTEERTRAIEEKQQQERDRQKEERERKKQEAIERSRARREQDPLYFEKHKKSIEEVKKESATVETESFQPEEEEDAPSSSDFDPFRSYQPKSRNKVHCTRYNQCSVIKVQCRSKNYVCRVIFDKEFAKLWKPAFHTGIS